MATQDTAPAQGPVPEPAAERPLEEHFDWREFAERYGRPLLVTVCVVAIAVSIAAIVRAHRRGAAERASELLGVAESPRQLQEILDQYASAPVAPSAMIRLAKAYYDAADYARAQQTYEEFMTRYPGHEWHAMAVVGKWHCVEARGQFQEALEGYDAFAKSDPLHYLAPQAMLGRVRCLEHLGRLAEAKAVCEDYLAADKKGAWTEVVETTLANLTRKIERQPGGG